MANGVLIAFQIIFTLFTIAAVSLWSNDGLLLKGWVIGVLVFFCISAVVSETSEGFLFELTPQKQCDGGPYMYSSNPAKQALCSKFTPKDLSRYECSRGYVGRPVWWDYSAESNSDWKNGRCDKIGVPQSDPQVL